MMEKTVKTRSYSDKSKRAISPSNLTDAQEKALEFANTATQLEEAKCKLLEQLKTIDQLREEIKQEQAKTAEMAMMALGLEDKVKELSGQEDNVNKVAELETRIKELTEALDKISDIATTGKVGQ
jgi:methyl-accepting chemotaxis protein